MNREVSFRTALFDNREVKPHFINDRCFGEDLATWLIEKLKGKDFSFTEPYQEDWGWEIEARAESERFFVQIGITDESIDLETAEWIVSIETARRGWFSFREKESKFLPVLCGEIDKILRDEREISRVRWLDRDDDLASEKPA